MTEKGFEKLLSWMRYLYWAELQWKSFEAELEGQSVSNAGRFHAKLSLWYASLYVVIEGWKAADLNDPAIDQLIHDKPSIVEALRRFRNSVYHFQESMIEPKHVEFLQIGVKSVYWTAALHDEFKSYMGRLPYRLNPDRNLANEFKELLRDIIGWFPDDTVELSKQRLTEIVAQAESKLIDAGDWSSPAATDLIAAISQIRELIKKTPDKPLKDLLDSLES